MSIDFVYLASGSPRRRQLLAQIGVPFRVLEIAVDERVTSGEAPAVYVERVARAKAAAGWKLSAAGPVAAGRAGGGAGSVAADGVRVFAGGGAASVAADRAPVSAARSTGPGVAGGTGSVAADGVPVLAARRTGSEVASGVPVLAADTVVVLDGNILLKPIDRDDAAHMLTQLSARTHEVITAVALAADGGMESRSSSSEVTFRAITPEEARRYWDTGEPRDKAGGYAIQGGAAIFVAQLRGSYSGVMGLPLYETAAMLGSVGVPTWR